jgi:SMODS and SLOG-associating 2TM effector domain 1/SMODS and SLOG-associating 2TM effector domain 3
MSVEDEVLRYAWGQYRVWATTSRRLKRKVSRWSGLVLLLTLSGTALGALAPFLSGQSSIKRLLSGVAAIALGMATYFAAQLLSESSREAWVKARALAEALKSESFKYITRTVPYDTADAPQVLTAKVDELSQMTSGILAETLSKEEREANAPSARWTIDDYIARRVRDQIDRFYLTAIERHRRSVHVARVIAVVLGVLAVVISAAGGMSESSSVGTAVAALLGVVTTTGAAVASWFQSGNHLENALSYQSAVAKLELLLARHAVSGGERSLVLDAEAVFETEHAAWLTKWRANAVRDAPTGGEDALPERGKKP